MISIMNQLEPRMYSENEVILHDQEVVEEVLFVVEGDVVVGYTINNAEYLAIKMCKRSIIGDIPVYFKQKSEFLYRAISTIHCQAIRRHNLQEIIRKYNFLG